MKEIFINVDSYNNEGIKTIQGNNNAEIYKICISKSKVRLSLVGKTVKLGYVMAGTTNGDVIEDLNITNAEQGEITFPITNKISKKDGVYTCQLAIYGADGFLEYTATFGLTVEANIFTKIAGEIADSKDFTYLENILDKASKLSEKLKENTSSATNANSNLESNITEANNINSKLLENTSTATSLNSNLESNINLAKEVKETIKDLDTKNIEATEKIQTLTGLNSKAEELSDNINKGLPLNSELVKNTESAKAANTNLLAVNQEATTKNTELQASLEKTKEFINGLDRSQNIPQIRMDVTELQNGLKSNQALEYQGSSISANDTLEGRTENMIIKGQTLNNLIKNGKADMVIDKSISPDNRIYRMKTSYPLTAGNTYIGYINITKFEGDSTYGLRIYGMPKDEANGYYTIAMKTGWHKFIWKTQSTTKNFDEIGIYMDSGDYSKNCKITFNSFMLFEQNSESEKIFLTEYFEGLKSFGEAEKVEDKYKISISSGYNLIDTKKGQTGAYLYNNGNFVSNASYKFVTIEKNEGILQSNNIATGIDVHITYWENENFIKGVILNKGESIEIKPPNNCNKIRISFNTRITEIVFIKYNKKDILIKEPLREGDYLYEDNGQVKVYRPTKQYTFTGNETSIVKWVTVTDENFIGFYITNDDIPNLTSKRSLVVCNNFPSVDGVITKRNMYIAANSVNICIEKSALTTPDIEGFRAWLKANPTTIVYQLAEPVVEIVENCVDIDLDTFVEKTYFNILNSLPGSLDFKVPSNIASIVQNTAREVNNIWDVINNLLVPEILDVNKKVALATIKNNLK